jgi:hypothetical protein
MMIPGQKFAPSLIECFEIGPSLDNYASLMRGRRHKGSKPVSDPFPFPRGEESESIWAGLLIDRLSAFVDAREPFTFPGISEWFTKGFS